MGVLIGILILIAILIFLSYRPDKTLDQIKEKYDFSHSNFIELQCDQLPPITVHYTDEGSKTANVIVLLHGMFSSLQTFDEWTTLLINNGYRVIRIDLPNHGASGHFSDQVISLSRSAAVVKAVLEKLQIKELSIAGNSMGGGVSWFFTSQYFEILTIQHLILIDSISPLNPYGKSNKFRDLLMDSMIGKGISKLTPKFLFRHLLKSVYGSKNEIDENTIDRYYDFLLLQGNRLAIISSKMEPDQGPTGTQRLELIQSAKIPTLILWGKQDRLIPIKTLKEFEPLLNASTTKTISYETLGHVPMEEDSETTFHDLLEFLQVHPNE